MTKEQNIQIQKMRSEGSSYSQISIVLGISENTVKSYCRRNKIDNIKRSISIVQAESVDQNQCKQCGKQLTQCTKGQPKKFCSDECRRKWWKGNDSQILRKAYYTLLCSGCKKEFRSYGNKERKFCSHACYINSRFKNEGELHESRAV